MNWCLPSESNRHLKNYEFSAFTNYAKEANNTTHLKVRISTRRQHTTIKPMFAITKQQVNKSTA